ncbi:hypothetical protein B0H19DRAFT_1252246 [Mycena capillaripes]|nr:hypothetical protein B0H19DRAFT_1252246 [Mycena capillaripes]
MSSIEALQPARAIYLQETLVELFANGVYAALFFATLYAMIFKRELHKKNLGLFLALVAMYILSTVHAATRWILIKNAFIDHADTTTSTVVYLVQPPLWLTVVAAVVFSTNTLISDFVLIWRCWTVWNNNRKVVVLPMICTLVGAGLGYRSIAEQAAYVLNPNLDINSFVDYATPYFILSLVTTCLATVYNLTQIMVESAILYSVALIIFLPFLLRDSFDDGYPQAVVAQVTGMAPTLIVARVSFGLARPDETWQAPVSSLGFSRSITFKTTDSELPTASVALSPIDANLSSVNVDRVKEEGPWAG